MAFQLFLIAIIGCTYAWLANGAPTPVAMVRTAWRTGVRLRRPAPAVVSDAEWAAVVAQLPELADLDREIRD